MKENKSKLFPESESISYTFGGKKYSQKELTLGQEIKLVLCLKTVLFNLPPSATNSKDAKELGMNIMMAALDYSEEFIFDAMSVIFSKPREEFIGIIHLADFLEVVDGFLQLNDIERLSKPFLSIVNQVKMVTQAKKVKNDLERS